jgi:hypothetical protein
MGKRIDSPYFAVQLGKPRPPAPSRAKPKKPLPKRRKGAARLKTAGKVVAGQKLRPLVEDRAYLDSLRDEPCFFTGLRGTPDDPVEAMHIGNPGKNLKSDDETLPARHSLVHHLTHLQGLIRILLPIFQQDPTLLVYLLRAAARERYRFYKAQTVEVFEGGAP